MYYVCTYLLNFKDFLKCNVNIEKPYEYQLLYDWLGKGLLINDCSDLWRERRKLLTPAFHYKILDEFVPIFNEKTDILLDRLRESADKESVNICDLVFPAALDIITETSTGFKINAQQKENLDYIQAVQDMGRILVNRVINPLLHSKWIFSMTKMGQQFKHNLNVSQTLTRRVIDERKRYLMQNKGNTDLETKDSKTRKRLAFLDLLLDHHLRDNTLSLEDIREEVDTFIFAGHDTTAICLSWTYHFIGLYPEIQRKLHQELDSVLTTDCMVTIDDIKRMPYLEAVIKESLRLRPPVPVILRAIKQDIQLGQYVVPRGVTLGLMIDVMHLDPDIYPDPLTFNPERFLAAGEGRDAFSFVPFSAGVRNCIGQKFALNELKIVLAKTLRLYHFQSLEPRDSLIEYNAIVKKPKNGIRIKVSPRYKA
ncbi:unnamed protein product [Medioppia subpectinata]|uniref:Cytochrome P450 n=1 Tax=Medioppia subpectinata TaxID=1979941 RepID=A0A7R9L695_9ACAR|nr:unnamed protein product [Medioppia subpectinata]CAG2115187.1 unnamed protein product [Medioppia subpectinata]